MVRLGAVRVEEATGQNYSHLALRVAHARPVATAGCDGRRAGGAGRVSAGGSAGREVSVVERLPRQPGLGGDRGARVLETLAAVDPFRHAGDPGGQVHRDRRGARDDDRDLPLEPAGRPRREDRPWLEARTA